MTHPDPPGEATAPSRPAPAALSVVVLSYNRRALLRRTLRALTGQDPAALEIVVVDNASSDGAPEMVKDEFPGVRLIERARNEGVRARNVGFQATRAPLLLSLDDDIELLDPETLGRIARRFAQSPALGALTLKICDEGREPAAAHWWHPLPARRFHETEFATDHVSEAALALRREALDAVGGYLEDLFWGGEEWDLVLGLMDAGYDVRYLPIPVAHGAPRGDLRGRADPRHSLLIRNRVWIAFRRLPLPSALAFALPRLALWGLRALRFGYAREYGRALVELLRLLPRVWAERRVISAETRRRLRALPQQAPAAGPRS